MWLKLLSRKNLGEMLKPQFVNGHWRKPQIQARQRAQLRGYFERAGVPWLYDAETPEVHETSTYNRRPKGHRDDSEVRLANVRKQLSMQADKLEKLRIEKMAARPWIGHDRILVGTLRALQAGETEAKKSGNKQSAAAAKAAETAELKELGIEGITKKSGSKSGMTSKGGNLGKKEREVLNMAKGNIGFEIEAREAVKEESKTK